MKILSKIKNLMNSEKQLEAELPQSEEVIIDNVSPDLESTDGLSQEDVIIEESSEVKEPVFQRCGCPENNKFRQDQLGERCMFCGKNFYSTN